VPAIVGQLGYAKSTTDLPNRLTLSHKDLSLAKLADDLLG